MILSTDNGIIRKRFGDLESLRLIREAGFDGIDFTFYEMAAENDLLALPELQRRHTAEEIARYAKELGLCFPQAHAPFDYVYGQDRGEKAYQDIVRSFAFCAALGCKQMVIHSLKFPDTVPVEESDRINREFLRSFLPYAREYDVNIGVECLFWPDAKRGCMRPRHGTPHHMNAFIDSLDDPRFVCCCDVGHCALTGCEPEDFIAGMDADRLTMLHIHDVDYRNDLHTLPFLSRLNWEAIARSLNKIGYKGAMNLEVLYFYDRFPSPMMPAALRLAAEAAGQLRQMTETADQV